VYVGTLALDVLLGDVRSLKQKRSVVRPLIADLRRTLHSADQSMTQLQGAIGDARPGIQAFSNQTLPEVGQLVRDLRATSQSLRDITDRMNQHGVGGIIGGPRLPDYRGGGRRH